MIRSDTHEPPRTAIPPLKKTPATSALAVFARAPVPGRAKTRLSPVLGARGAAALQSALISDTIQKVRELSWRVDCYLFLAGRSALFCPPSHWRRAYQKGRSVGARLARAFGRLLANYQAVVIVGTDSPELSIRLLRQAWRELRTSDAVLGPCPDGGFFLIGLRRSPKVKPDRLFNAVHWGTS